MNAQPPYTSDFNANKVTSVTLSSRMKADVEALAKAKYGPRGMARWLEEHLGALLEDRSFISRVGASEAVTEMDVRKSIRLTPTAEQLLMEGVRRVRKIDPFAENPRSKILRATFDFAIDKAEGSKPKPPEVDVGIADVVLRLKRKPTKKGG